MGELHSTATVTSSATSLMTVAMTFQSPVLHVCVHKIAFFAHNVSICYSLISLSPWFEHTSMVTATPDGKCDNNLYLLCNVLQPINFIDLSLPISFQILTISCLPITSSSIESTWMAVLCLLCSEWTQEELLGFSSTWRKYKHTCT